MADDTPDSEIKRILEEARVIAVVGASPNPERVSHRIAGYLLKQGFEIVPVNPVAAGEVIHGRKIVASLAEASHADMVDIFRRSELVPEVVDAALEHLPDLRTVWMQLGVRHSEAAEKATARGVTVVQDRCPAIEMPRLSMA
ncbi:MAG: CoA-binding protein [Pseudomonadota bacterium]